jgi:hypothetical protein
MLSSTVLGIYIFMSEGQHATEILGLGSYNEHEGTQRSYSEIM